MNPSTLARCRRVAQQLPAGTPEYAEDAAAIRELVGLVDRLPHTADGVPVVPGIVIHKPALPEKDYNTSAVWDDGSVTFHNGEMCKANATYSTRAAAEAMQKAKEQMKVEALTRSRP